MQPIVFRMLFGWTPSFHVRRRRILLFCLTGSISQSVTYPEILMEVDGMAEYQTGGCPLPR